MFSKLLTPKSLREGICSYVLVRNFPIHLIRNNMNSYIDIILSASRYDTGLCSNPSCEYDICFSIGLGKVPMYINSLTKKNTLTISFKISTLDFNYKQFL